MQVHYDEGASAIVAGEADEQSGLDRHGTGGAKGGGQGKCEPAKHAPDSEPGKVCHRCWSAYGKP